MKVVISIVIVFLLSIIAFTNCSNSGTENAASIDGKHQNSETLEYITTEQFKVKVFDFEKNKDWKFAGTKPCIIDFYADWCGPCKKLTPILSELADEYKGKINIYKVNIDKEPALAQLFGIQSIPALLFCTMEGKPSMSNGFIGKSDLNKMIQEILLTKK